jgi:alpha-glucosidase
MSLAAPPRFRLTDDARGNHLILRSDGAAVAHVFVLEQDIIRLLILPAGELRGPRTWSLAPGAEDCAAEGRDRFDLSGFALPAFHLEGDADTLTVQTARLRLLLRLGGLFTHWQMRVDEAWIDIAADRATQAYDFGYWSDESHPRPRHYLFRAPGEKFFGLGERAGPMDRAGRRYRLSNIDAMGYDAAASDPLYKHIPFSITWRAGAAYGLFYDTHADCTFDFGREIDNYHGPYRSFIAESGDLDYYFIAGPAVADVAARFTWLTGRPTFLPKWSLGYSGSSMAYSDDPQAQAKLAEFLDLCAEYDICCESFHLSSGYTSIGTQRYVFTWNADKFPDPEGLAAAFAARGVRLVANVKPALLRDHPRFAEAEALFVAEAEGGPSLAQFWGDLGAYLDFTRPETAAWWGKQVRETLLARGVAATWNDNNEFEIVSPKAVAHGFGASLPAQAAKPVQTMLMVRASRAAQQAHAPGLRPFVVTRAGGAGMQRHAQTWSGDNTTSWETLRYNIKMGLGLALSGVSNAGHDIGGFAGPAPDAELLARWVGFGVFLPRFSIHSWNNDGSANAPWMHPAALDDIRSLIKFRVALIPYLYDLAWRHHRHYEPIVRPLFHDFPAAPESYVDGDDFLLGAHLLVAPVTAPGEKERTITPPAGADWWDFWRGGGIWRGGGPVRLPAPFRAPPLLARAGGIVAMNVAPQHFGKRADQRGFAVFPLHVGAWEQDVFEDDGESEAYRDGAHRLWRFSVSCDAKTVALRLAAEGDFPGAPKTVELLFPAGERRRLDIPGGQERRLANGRRQVTLAVG